MTISVYDAIGQLMSKEGVDYTGGEMQYIIKSGGYKQGTYFYPVHHGGWLVGQC